MERVSRSELNLEPLVASLLPGDCQYPLSPVPSQNRQSQRGDQKSVLAGATTQVEHGSRASAFRCQTHYGWLRTANIPRRGSIVL